METASPSLAVRLVQSGIIAPGSGTFYDIVSGRRKPSAKLAVQIFRETGEKFGPLAGLTDAEVAVAVKMHG